MISKIINTGKNTPFFSGEFELIENGFSSGEENMKFDFERTMQCSAGSALPMFRLYGWNPWCVSLGAHQKESDILADECSKRGFDIVRRPTGGRAVLHANEITYSVVVPMSDNMNIHEVYRDIHILLLKALENLGCENLDFGKSQPDFKELYKREAVSVACFASSARYEIEHNGKKVVGSAQRLFGNTLLQHGSVLIGDGHEQLAYISNVKSEESRKVLYDYILSHSATIESIMKRQASYEECAAEILSLF